MDAPSSRPHPVEPATGCPAERLAELARTMHAQQTPAEAARHAVEHAVDAFGCTAAALLVVPARGRLECAAATDDRLAELPALLAAAGGGPDVDLVGEAAADGLVHVADTRTDERWPAWAAALAAAGLHSALVARLATGAGTHGTLAVYDERPGAFGEDDRCAARALAGHVSVALAALSDRAHLWRAVDARWLIGQAQGILMERFSMDADQAFAVLRRYSQDRNVKLRVLAEQLVRERRLPE